jgi:natural product precursor
MKKTKKLTLVKETVRSLAKGEMEKVAGGGAAGTDNASNCHCSAYCTLDC